ncbi:trigger factor [Clostridium botulinum]|uniref:Trigger factor n=2 Tax=Clostridium botulinum A TaxID=36826 RepID=TIG_CLOBH|nr:trigger factor [Clostridium botulinum]A5I6W2.1 RecName: Full=Trigger factor; Short=TF; AltName: Full=PPIase [Clostridium botulinum A str. Hall]A7FYI3.1 RecName: Full=Trigger factor; Short=TF; AltName: Full=PPIase [Clostridium botulinum A str. ATCC 19397]ABS35399.1 trigger factor [Clostridium botulinum A str. ATCC 19397]ABS37493.1 trigger factor [Clostridium botulinum A str. Hall]APQ96015.1 trigger factor [Clostridium botulinum]AUM89257.1 trigger factor [Clostridium botulinum]AUN12223.1 tr
MNVKVENIEKNVVKLEITVDSEKFNEAVKKSFKKNAKRFNVPGFRKGKAPLNIIKKYYGEGVLFEDAINFCCEDTYPKAIEENNIKPVDYPQIDVVQIGEGKDFIYTAEVTTVPEVKLGEYKGVEVKKVSYEVEDEAVENELKSMQEKNARVSLKEEGEIEKGNIAIIDFKGYVDGKAFEGGEAKDYEIEIGSGTFIGDFEDQLVGLKKDESKEVNVSFPEEYGREDLNGKPATFEVTIKDIKVKELPALDDEFAKEVSEFDTLEELKSDIKDRMKKELSEKAKAEYEEAVVEAVGANAEIEIPKVMIEKEIENMVRDLEMRLKYQGLDLKSYYEFTNSSEEKVKEYMRETAEKRVKTDLIMQEIAKVEDIKATEEELKEKAMEVAKQYGQKDVEKTAELIANAQKAYLEIDIVNGKVLDLLVESSKEIA